MAEKFSMMYYVPNGNIVYHVLSIMCLQKIFVLFILTTYYILLNAVPKVQAQTMSNDNYIIKMQNLNTFSGVTTGDDYKLRSTTGGFNPTSSEGVNFKVRTGFESLAATAPFSISLSSNLVDFGVLNPTNPIIRTIDLRINSLTAYGYSVLIFENEPLTTISENSKEFIPDTTCDNGQCSTENTSEWNNALTYGFGYRCDNLAGTDCDISFARPNYYRHFPDLANNDDLVSIMAGVGSNNKEARISYKVNISGTQAQDTYSNIVTYIAVPNF